MSPRMPQESPNRPLESLKMAPRDPQSVKIASKRPEMDPKMGDWMGTIRPKRTAKTGQKRT